MRPATSRPPAVLPPHKVGYPRTTITERRSFAGALERIVRLGLQPLWQELEDILTGVDLCVNENSPRNVRCLLEERFRAAGGWARKQGRVDWIKCHSVNDTRVCLGVEIRFSSGRDILIVDVYHLQDELVTGRLDVGVLVVPSNCLAAFLTGRVARYSDAVSAVERARAQDLPLMVVAIEHDGPGNSLAKRRT